MKTFTAATMAQALALVKQHFGSDAIILHTRTYKQGGLFGFGVKTVVEITATNDPSVGRRRNGRTPAAPAQAAPQRGRGDSSNAGDLIRRTYAAAHDELNKKAPPAARPPLPKQPAVAVPPAPVAPDSDQLVDELQAVKRMVRQMMKRQAPRVAVGKAAGEQAVRSQMPDMPDKLFDQYLALLEREVAEELAEEVIQQVCDKLKSTDCEDESLVRQAVLDVIAQQIPTDETAGLLKPTPDGRPRTIALVGPTGVGKTTTVAKLSATFKLKHKKNVGLITLDTYRIAAVDQLRTYANIIGIPLHVVATPDELSRALRHCAGCDVILIDTAGRSQRDDPRLEQLKSLIAVADPHEVHLVLSSTCSQPVMLEVVDRFAAVQTDRIIFTKLDEAVSFGVLLNVARKVNKRLSYITTGQEVPHQIEPSRPERLAALVLGDGVSC